MFYNLFFTLFVTLLLKFCVLFVSAHALGVVFLGLILLIKWKCGQTSFASPTTVFSNLNSKSRYDEILTILLPFANIDTYLDTILVKKI